MVGAVLSTISKRPMAAIVLNPLHCRSCSQLISCRLWVLLLLLMMMMLLLLLVVLLLLVLLLLVLGGREVEGAKTEGVSCCT